MHAKTPETPITKRNPSRSQKCSLVLSKEAAATAKAVRLLVEELDLSVSKSSGEELLSVSFSSLRLLDGVLSQLVERGDASCRALPLFFSLPPIPRLQRMQVSVLQYPTRVNHPAWTSMGMWSAVTHPTQHRTCACGHSRGTYEALGFLDTLTASTGTAKPYITRNE